MLRMLHETLREARADAADRTVERRERSMEVLQYATAFLALVVALVLAAAR